MQDELEQAAEQQEEQLRAEERHAAEQEAFAARQAERRAQFEREAQEQAARREALAAEQAKASEAAQRSSQAAAVARKQQQIKELRTRINSFATSFKQQHGRALTAADLSRPACAGHRVDRDRLSFLVGGTSNSGLQSNATARRAQALDRTRPAGRFR